MAVDAPSKGPRLIAGAGLFVACLFLLARFFALEADPPADVSWSGALLTDEGAYASAAIWHRLLGEPYRVGEHNPAVVTPVLPFLERLSFQVFGMSLVACRLPAVLLFIGLTAISWWLLRRHFGEMSGILGALLLSTHFLIFVYSRLALLELPMMFFVLASAWAVLGASPQRPRIAVGVGGALMGLAVLTKTTAVFAVPPLLVAIVLERGSWRAKRTRLVLFSVAMLAAVALFFALVVVPHRESWDYYWSRLADEQAWRSLGDYLRNVAATVRNVARCDPVLAGGVALSAAACLRAGWRRAACHRGLVFLLLAYPTYVSLLTLDAYQPTRYLLVLLVLSCLILAAAQGLTREMGWRRWSATLGGVALVAVGLNGYRSLSLLTAPERSFWSMCQDLKLRLDRRSSVLMGETAFQVSLETGVVPANAELGPRPFAWRVRRFRPTHFIAVGPLRAQQEAVLSEDYEVVLEATYTVLRNYYGGEPTHFYRLLPRRPDRKPDPGGGSG